MSKARQIGYGGARGGGKSWAMRRKFVLLALRYDRLRLLLLRRTYPELRENHILPLQMELQGLAQYKDVEKAFTFPNQSRIKLGYCESESDVFQYHGQEYDVIGLEEATQFTETQRDFLTMCNRTIRDDFSPRMYYTANPGGVGHAWFKRLFIDREYRGKEKEADYVFIPAKVWDNEVLMKNNPEYVEHLENLPEEQRRAFLDGDWDIFAGQFFKEFRREKHVVEPFEIPSHWKKFRSIDWGFNDYCCVLWYAIDGDRRVYVYRELYINQTLASDVAKKIVAMTKEKIHMTAASPDMWQKRGAGKMVGESIADSFRGCGVHITPADNDRLNGWQRVHEFLAVAPDNKPYLQIFSTCKNLIRTLPTLIHDDHKIEDVSDSCEDHAAESLRYGLMTRPRPSKVISIGYRKGGTYTKGELMLKGFKKYQINKLVRDGQIRLIGGL